MKWVCEWHSDEAAKIVAESVDIEGKAIVKYCPKCKCITFHAEIEVKESDHEV